MKRLGSNLEFLDFRVLDQDVLSGPFSSIPSSILYHDVYSHTWEQPQGPPQLEGETGTGLGVSEPLACWALWMLHLVGKAGAEVAQRAH